MPNEVRVDVRKLYNEHNEDSFYLWDDYQPMLNAFGKIVVQVDDDSYQGDSRILYDNDGRIGHLIFGWGSCSGCDALMGCETIDEVQELCDKLYGDIKWFDNKKEALDWFNKHDWEGDFLWQLYEEETIKYITKCKEYLCDEDDE